jgi:hypothetical protein
LICHFIGEGVGGYAAEGVEFFVLVVFYVFRNGCQQTFLFARLVLTTAAVRWSGLYLGHTFQFAVFHFLAINMVTYEPCDEGYDAQDNEE